jgi:glutathione synthase/RimK-type ligase-like ATP-grasp enzyme
MDVALATAAALPGLYPDDRILLHALRARGLSAEPVIWEDPHQDWSEVRLCLIRSAWDYSFRRGAFLDFAGRAAAAARLWNPLELVRWNTHKRYLVDLDRRGVPTVETVLLPAGSRVDLVALLRERGWDQVIVKAAVAQSGRYAIRVSGANRTEGQRHLGRLLPHEDMLLQPYLERVEHEGELSVVWIDGRVTHAVRKRAAAGDFRVHDDYGGEVTAERPDRDAVEVVERALAVTEPRPIYARIDLVRDQQGRPRIMEYELVEPELFFRFSADAVERLTDAVLARLD